MSIQFSRFTPRHKFFKASYAVIALLAGFVGYQTVHYSSAEKLPSSDVQLQMSKPSYTVGEVVRFTIINNLSEPVYITNNCPNEPLTVFKQQQNAWLQVHDRARDADKCLNEPRSYAVLPKAQLGATYIFWPKLFNTPGHYRITAPIEGFDNGPSAEFDIVAQ
jgi:hypothetical protein